MRRRRQGPKQNGCQLPLELGKGVEKERKNEKVKLLGAMEQQDRKEIEIKWMF